ncbi:MAG: PAS domain S-box protein [Candidatus Sumerlaeia bacterium]|nr:PAS domain S-box protein [Candidatus Sumerlaeia bacterium]
MTDSAYLALVHNAALLIALAYVHELFVTRHSRLLEDIPRKILTGLILGTIGLSIMMTPWVLTEGIVFDTRSVLLGVSGLFFGAIPTGIAMFMLSAFRIYQGGDGALPGVCVILASGLVGFVWRLKRRDVLPTMSWWELYLVGLAVHIAMVTILWLTVPWPDTINVATVIVLPVMLIYPVATMVLGKVMATGLQRQNQGSLLIESEERYRTLFENNHTIMLLVEPDSANIFDANPCAAAYYGWSRDQMRSMTMHDISTLDNDLVKERLKDAKTTGTHRYHSKHRLADGIIREVEVFTGPIQLDGKKYLYSIIHDITERLASEAELVANRDRMEELLVETESARAALARALEEEKRTLEALRNSELRFSILIGHIESVAVQGYAPDGKIRYWNNASEKLYGYTREEAIGRDIVELICRDDYKAHARKAITKMVQTNKPMKSEELVLKHKDGSDVHVFTSHTIVPVTGSEPELFAMDVDLSELKLATREINKLTQAIEQSPISIVITNTAGEIQYVNNQFTETTGYTLEEARGKSQRILDSGSLSDRDHEKIWEAHKDGKVWRGEFENRRKDGTLFWERVTISPMRDEGGTITGFLSVKENITEQKTMEDALRQSQKMQAVGRLAGGVAHDFNNMLGVILGYTELAREQIDPSTPLHKQLLEIQRAALRSADLTRQLLAFARKQTIQPRTVDINECVTNTLKMIGRLIGEHIELKWIPCNDAWYIRIDPTQLDQVLANLSVNARDAIEGSGTVTIKTWNHRIEPEEETEERPAGDYVALSVIDTGSGITPDAMEHLFEPFYTTKDIGKGTGLGLPTVYGIIKQNGGFVEVETEKNRGTAFHVHFPRAETVDEEEVYQSNSLPPKGSETIMVVEDERPILALAEAILKKYGYKVITTHDPGTAIELATNHQGDINLLITDVILPNINGRELAQQIRELHPEARVIFMSGYTADVISDRGVIPKGVHFLPKPFRSTVFAAKVREVLDLPPQEVD